MGWTHLQDETPKARKAYQCYLCERGIATGEKHIKRTGVTSDGLLVMRMHLGCVEKTRTWDDFTWECHDAAEFRRYELEIQMHPEEEPPTPGQFALEGC